MRRELLNRAMWLAGSRKKSRPALKYKAKMRLKKYLKNNPTRKD